MAGVASGFTVILAEDAHDGSPARDYIVTDGGVLYSSGDHGATWCCHGLVDPQAFLLDLGFAEAWETADADMVSPGPVGRRVLAA